MKFTYFPSVAGMTLKINLATVAAVLGAAMKLYFDFQAGNSQAVVADITTIVAALGLPSLWPTPTPPAPLSAKR